MSAQSTTIPVLILVFPEFNTLDVNGPLEVLRNTYLKTQPTNFSITVAAADEHTTAGEDIIIKRHISLPEALSSISSYSILIVPGASPSAILPHLKPGDPHFAALLDVCEAFSRLGPVADGTERTLLSICTGALMLGYHGLFDGLRATTHFMVFDKLRELCADYAERNPGAKGTVVVPQSGGEPVRWVDAGLNNHGVRVVSAGGVSCGMDATLFVLSERLGRATALKVAGVMEYAWRENV
ncbi:DJ-1 PfpI family protein [Coniophora puteana RWD-64-598 SS2]|uniref:DJ-1 PfpI family protein n=1 Tax=Coniophora puteana (strain RWD-64-598) TaxID=741705 RepID=R7SDG7_CONPW|nr:DJ-1 PfpI family protein [Coniophora puteana RWD-64-598 SS2]EIW74198.1 DJ-1 PfpI family protein [Coniophora puteana RWD-64-598 SS2]